ncbi:tryptophan-rich sensory protein [Clostridium chauvoei]|uniref:TspO/MBR family protein n=1 Tax=Clostridium chauvoei TaxID=46867 RepID=UPI001C84CA22|nr:TspO/MBR family protein [Clostridium chauvoei]MBX7320788.1 tryptophan-rich sensory protein [Clostridium chauvoei]MBX7338673.1 tryptophan-rich sensory protein [Clostridium chauvoei]
MKEKAKKIKNKVNKKGTKHSFNIFKVNGQFKFIPLIINILIPVVGGLVVGYLNKNTMGTYAMLKKPIFTPPSYVFPIIWTILYVLMGISAYRIYMRNKQGANDNGAYFFYLVQLIFNFMWSFIFFTFRLYGIAFIWLIILFILVIITFIKFIKVDKISGILLIPYMIWLIFAGVLNFFIWMFNEM